MVLESAKASTLLVHSLHASRAFDKHCLWMTSEEEVNVNSEQGGPLKNDYNDNTNVSVAWNSLRGGFGATTVIHTVSWLIFDSYAVISESKWKIPITHFSEPEIT